MAILFLQTCLEVILISGKKKIVSREKPEIYAGWDYGLKFVDFHPALKKIYCDRGEELEKDNLALVIPLPNLTLYFMLRYLDNLSVNKQTEIFNDVIKRTASFVLSYQLPLPETYHDTFFNSSLLSEEDKTIIHQTYDQLLTQQIKDREKFLELDHSYDMTSYRILAIDDSDSEKDDDETQVPYFSNKSGPAIFKNIKNNKDEGINKIKPGSPEIKK